MELTYKLEKKSSPLHAHLRTLCRDVFYITNHCDTLYLRLHYMEIIK